MVYNPGSRPRQDGRHWLDPLWPSCAHGAAAHHSPLLQRGLGHQRPGSERHHRYGYPACMLAYLHVCLRVRLQSCSHLDCTPCMSSHPALQLCTRRHVAGKLTLSRRCWRMGQMPMLWMRRARPPTTWQAHVASHCLLSKTSELHGAARLRAAMRKTTNMPS